MVWYWLKYALSSVPPHNIQVYLFLGRCGELIVHICGNKTIFTLLHREYSQWFLGIDLR